MTDRFQQIRDSKALHKPAVQVIMDAARDFRCTGPEDYDEFYKKMQNLIYQQLERAYVAGRMSTESWK